MKLLLSLSLLALVACGGGGSGTAAGYCDESAGLVYCQGSTNCAFDPATIDCTAACANLQAACMAGTGCGDVDGCGSPSSCTTACNAVKNQACPNVTFGCYAQETTCGGIVACRATYLD